MVTGTMIRAVVESIVGLGGALLAGSRWVPPGRHDAMVLLGVT